MGGGVYRSVSGVGVMVAGFLVVPRLPVRVGVAAVPALELPTAVLIRDNLTLNGSMLLYPLDAVRTRPGGL